MTLLALVALAFIVVTGGAVRLSQSGLGCPDWPTCAQGHVVAPFEKHAWIEFGNRLVTGAVSIAVILAVLGSLVRRPRRTDLVVLSLGLVAGVIGQIVLGGLVVLFHLAPPLVMGHFVLSMLLLLDAAVLHHRARRDPVVAERPVEGSPEHAPLGWLLVASASVAILLGTVVTGSGPHAGSHDGQLVERLPFAITDVARIHSIAVWILLALTLFTARGLRVAHASAALMRKAEILVAVLVAQGAVGYVQYFTGVPALLVGVHIAGAVVVWLSVLDLALAIADRAPDRRPVVAVASA
ncbi:MAG TPA: COX15/CtaA family protein [Acidimicrobiales bacterium]|nr:COX15/CtaA family protein [Acidimicrobiales bacterium]